MSKEFEKWAAGYFSWAERTPELMREVDGCELAWEACKAEILKTLKQPIQNADLSYEEVDSRFIAKIEENI